MTDALPPLPLPDRIEPVEFGCDGRWWDADAMRAYAAAAVAAQWVRCDERMPESSAEVLVWLAEPIIKGGSQVAIDAWDEQYESPVAWSSATIFVGMGWDSGTDWEDITHWMPLPPAPPKE
jgi:hypothetical protein